MKKTSAPTRLLLASLATCALSATSYAETVVQYGFGTTGSETIAATTLASGVTASNYGQNAVMSFAAVNSTSGSTTGNSAYTSNTGAFAQSNTTYATFDDRYFEFSITAAPGTTVNVSEFSFFYVGTGGATSSSSADLWKLRASSDNTWSASTPDLASGSLLDRDTTATFALTQVSESITLTAISGGTMYFRFYAWGAGSSGQNTIFDDITLNGSVSAIPEPSSYAALLGGAGMAVVLLRRRRL